MQIVENLPKCSTFYFLLCSILLLFVSTAILDPSEIEPYMFTQQITGIREIITPNQIFKDGKLIEEKYVISMEKVTQKMLPRNFPATPLYVYSAMTSSGKVAEFPGPAIIAKKNVPIKVVWINKLNQKHMLPVDFNQPFINSTMFRNEVPVVPHAHGVATKISSDGQPGAYWTASGAKSEKYSTEEPCQKNEAVFEYPNEQDPGLFWYHDHAYGITRLNVYAGLAGFYQIVQNPAEGKSLAENNIEKYFGEDLNQVTLYFAVADKTFQTNGRLYYPTTSDSSLFTAWVPQFFGNTITVNGKVWPKVILNKKIYRMVFLNACQCRYLNIYFLNQKKKLNFQLIRLQGDYFQSSVIVSQYFLSPGARLQIAIDLTQINGEIVVKNNAEAPHPMGDPANLIDKFTGTIMKIIMKEQSQSNMKKQKTMIYAEEGEKKINLKVNPLKIMTSFTPNILNFELKKLVMKQNTEYPAFPTGQPIFTTLSQINDENDQSLGMLIDGIGMEMGGDCQGWTFEAGKVYDIHVINLTPDTHPIHFHLVNFQKVYSYPFNVDQYTQDWYDANGGEPGPRGWIKTPKILDPQPYISDNKIFPKSYEKVFRDIIDSPPGMVTVLRIKFSHNNGANFGFRVSGSRYVWHCHMLQHEDNQMMRYFCLK